MDICNIKFVIHSLLLSHLPQEDRWLFEPRDLPQGQMRKSLSCLYPGRQKLLEASSHKTVSKSFYLVSAVAVGEFS